MSKRLLALLLLLIMLLSLASCGGESIETTDTTTAPVESTAAAPEIFELTASYRIIMGEEYRQNDDILNAATVLRRALKTVCGIKAELVFGGEAKEDSAEILLGPSSRPESMIFQSDLGANDYGYRINADRQIIIGCGNIIDINQATLVFCRDVLGYQDGAGDAHTVSVQVGTEYIYRSAYAYSDLSLQKLDIQTFTIAYVNRNAVTAANILVKELGKYTGDAPSVINLDDLTGQEKAVIVVGALDRDGEKTYRASCDGYMVEFTDEADGGITIGIAAKNAEQYKKVIGLLFESATLAEEGKSAHLSIPKRDLAEFFYSGIPQWSLKKETVETVAEGVTHIMRTYTDEEGLPYLTHALILDPAKTSLTMGTAGDTTAYTTNSPKNVADHMRAAVANGKNVIAGINADFFDMGGDNHPSGLTVKDGQLITKGDAGRPYFAVTKTGEVKVGRDGSAANTDELQNAWGGSNVIVEKGSLADLAMGGEFGQTNHPRTLIGVTAEGKIILATIDGRQASVSNGASLARCAIYMLSLGAETAMNLDGGGSTTLVLREGDKYSTVNSPSGGVLRRVYNSVLVVAK